MNAVEVYRPPAPAGSLALKDAITVGEILAKSGYFKDATQMSQAVAKILAGQEVGVPPVQAMTGIFIVEGKVSFSANLMASMIKRSGRYSYRFRQHTEKVCEIEYFEGSESVGVSTFTWEEASRANLTNKPVWKNYPRNMLFARAMSNGARWYCGDIFGGPPYTPEELGAEVDADGQMTRPLAGVIVSPDLSDGEPVPIRPTVAYGPELTREQRYRARWEELAGRARRAGFLVGELPLDTPLDDIKEHGQIIAEALNLAVEVGLENIEYDIEKSGLLFKEESRWPLSADHDTLEGHAMFWRDQIEVAQGVQTEF